MSGSIPKKLDPETLPSMKTTSFNRLCWEGCYIKTSVTYQKLQWRPFWQYFKWNLSKSPVSGSIPKKLDPETLPSMKTTSFNKLCQKGWHVKTSVTCKGTSMKTFLTCWSSLQTFSQRSFLRNERGRLEKMSSSFSWCNFLSSPLKFLVSIYVSSLWPSD